MAFQCDSCRSNQLRNSNCITICRLVDLHEICASQRVCYTIGIHYSCFFFLGRRSDARITLPLRVFRLKPGDTFNQALGLELS